MARHSLDTTADYKRDMEEQWALNRGGYIRSSTWRTRRATPTIITTIRNVIAMQAWLKSKGH